MLPAPRGEPAGSSQVPAPAPAASFAPAVFRHPAATREIRLDGHLVAYAFRRARRRSIGFVVGVEGLAVSAPRWVGMGDVEAALQAKAGWICGKLASSRSARGACRPRASVGATARRSVSRRAGDRRARSARDRRGAQHRPAPRCRAWRGLTLHIGLPHTAEPAQIRDAVQSWLQRQARRVFEERCQHYAQRLNVRCKRLALSSAQTRWGSASADGSIRLHWRLIHFAMPTIDYVVAHELAHLREMNHSPRFWDVVRSVLPDFEAARGTLKEGVVPVFD